jgi:putative phosphoesterase
LGIVSDVHCNLAGLQGALDRMGEIDELLCLGDSIFEYRFSNEVVALLRARGARVIQGNHEEGFFGPQGVRARAQGWIDREQMEWLGAQPHRLALERDGLRLLLVHSTPWEPRGAYIHPESAQLCRFAEADADVVMFGHTHHQLVRRIGHVLVINPGSAGDARDHRNGRQLSCAVLDTATQAVAVIDYKDGRLA